MTTIISRIARRHQPAILPILLLKSENKQYMSVIFILLLVSISVAGLFLFAFLWNVKSGQYDDEMSPPVRILFEDTPPTKETK